MAKTVEHIEYKRQQYKALQKKLTPTEEDKEGLSSQEELLRVLTNKLDFADISLINSLVTDEYHRLGNLQIKE